MRYRVVSCGRTGPSCVCGACTQTKIELHDIVHVCLFVCREGIQSVVEDQPRLCVGVCVCVCVCTLV